MSPIAHPFLSPWTMWPWHFFNQASSFHDWTLGRLRDSLVQQSGRAGAVGRLTQDEAVRVSRVPTWLSGNPAAMLWGSSNEPTTFLHFYQSSFASSLHLIFIWAIACFVHGCGWSHEIPNNKWVTFYLSQSYLIVSHHLQPHLWKLKSVGDTGEEKNLAWSDLWFDNSRKNPVTL